ncbi:MAG TPA: CoA transferase [Nocardioides sp.]|nr:CoA transferase [Nocardioides sp.]
MSVGRFARHAWADLDMDPALLDMVDDQERPVPLPSSLAVGELAWDSVAIASVMLGQAGADGGLDTRRVALDPERIAAAYTSERHFRLDGEPVEPWAPFSGFWRAADGWVRTHANYTHHARRLLEVLGLASSTDRASLERAIGRWRTTELEDAAAEHGALAFAVRTPQEWTATEQGGHRGHPWLRCAVTGDAPPRDRRTPPRTNQPLAGVRVLDLTRVIAGPVAGRTLALAGADVLRVDPPALVEPEWQHLDSGHHKRSTLLDLRSKTGSDSFAALAASADILLLGYAPEALARLHLDPASVADRFPGLVSGYVSAWSPEGPWARRRGFDSLVQAASGIAMVESRDGQRPGVMPAQALDHSTGYMLAAATVGLWLKQLREGGTRTVSMSLQSCAEALLHHRPDCAPDSTARSGRASGAMTPEALASHLVDLSGPAGTVTTPAPAVGIAGGLGVYGRAATPWGADAAEWL